MKLYILMVIGTNGAGFSQTFYTKEAIEEAMEYIKEKRLGMYATCIEDWKTSEAPKIDMSTPDYIVGLPIK